MRNDARNLVLVGPMGSGKSHVGRLLAGMLGLQLVDVDACIEDDAGMSVTAIFDAEGEAGFRARERRMLAATLSVPGQVVATGGGAVIDAGSRAAMRARGDVVYLQVGLDEQLRRLEGDASRPLLAVPDRARRLAALQAAREPLYREVAALVVATGGRTPESIAAAIAEWRRHQQESRA